MPPVPPLASAPAPFSEKEFYLREFRGRAVAFAVPAAEIRDLEPLRAVARELVANGTRVIALSTERATLESLLGPRVISAAAPRLEGQVWRQLREGAALGLLVAGSLAFAPACRAIALRLGLAKLVWLDREGGVTGPTGGRLSFVHLAELRELLAAGAASLGMRRLALLWEVEAMLSEGLPAVNVCSVEGLADELFSYAGSGTLFTRERYIMVRRLGLDDFDAADDLITRGVEEGYLAPRPPEDVEAVLASGFGAFVEGRHLAGIGALLVDEPNRAAEIASLYTLTRFLGEGVGGHLVSFAVERARERGLDYVFACSTSERVGSFFERHGFRSVPAEAVPPAKWRGYDAARRARVRCYRLELR